MNKELTAECVKNNARRRLVRGVFSAPAALTLYSGSVAASSVSCLAKQLSGQNAITTLPPSGIAGLVKVPLVMLATGGQTAKFVHGANIAMLAPPGGSYLSSTQVQLVSKTGGFGSYDVGGIYPAPSGLAATSPTEYVAVRVSATGKVEGVLNIGSASGTTALYSSCWTSFGGVAYYDWA